MPRLGVVARLHVAAPILTSHLQVTTISGDPQALRLGISSAVQCSAGGLALRPRDASHSPNGGGQPEKIRREPVQHDVGPGSLLPPGSFKEASEQTEHHARTELQLRLQSILHPGESQWQTSHMGVQE